MNKINKLGLELTLCGGLLVGAGVLENSFAGITARPISHTYSPANYPRSPNSDKDNNEQNTENFKPIHAVGLIALFLAPLGYFMLNQMYHERKGKKRMSNIYLNQNL